jgi:hypothetical protein
VTLLARRGMSAIEDPDPGCSTPVETWARRVA